MRVLVSGGNGYVGQRLVTELAAKGHAVSVLGRRRVERPDVSDVCIYDGRIDTLSHFMDRWRPEAVVNLAADLTKVADAKSVDSLIDTNVKLTAHLAQTAVDAGTGKYINISTYSTSMNGVDYRPQTLYAATKRAAEDLLAYYHQSTPLKVCTLCFYDVYGADQPHARFLNDVLRGVRDGSVTMSAGEQEICFLYVDDAVSAIVYSLEHDGVMQSEAENIYSVYGDEVFRLKDIAPVVAGVLGLPAPKINATLPYRKNEIMRVKPRYSRLPGWRPRVAFKDGLRAMAGGRA
jgi:nucleoside-diphosphate-sugar epimerase